MKPQAPGPHIAGLFEASGDPERGTLELRGEPLRERQLFQALDLSLPGMEHVRTSVEREDLQRAAAELLSYYRCRTNPPWPSLALREDDGQQRGKLPQPRVLPAPVDPHLVDHPADDWFSVIDFHTLVYWSELATCYQVTREERFAALWVEAIIGWIRKYPLREASMVHGKGFWDSFSVNMRCASWIHAIPCFLNSRSFTPGFLVALLTSLFNHARLTQQVPYSDNNNFVIIEGVGLAEVALFLPELIGADLWREAAFGRLDGALRAQYRPDGVHDELSPCYHAWCTEMYLDTMDHAAKVGYRSRYDWLSTLRKHCDFLLGISRPDGYLFRSGDADELTDPRPELLKYMSVSGMLVPEYVARATDGRAGEWPRKRHCAFPAGGFFCFRSDWSDQAIWLGLRCGSDPVDPFHTQPDNGTFELMASGRLLMRDPGVYTYTRGSARDAFRRTAAHQALTLGGKDSDRAVRLLQWVEDDGEGNASLTVEIAAHPDMTHRRTVFFVSSRCFVLVDEALGDAVGDLDLHFQFTPGPLILDAVAGTARTAFEKGGNVLVWAPTGAPVALESEAVWLSPGPRESHLRESLPAVRYRHLSGRCPARFVTVLAPYKDGAVPDIRGCTVEGGIGADRIGVTLHVDAGTHHAERVT